MKIRSVSLILLGLLWWGPAFSQSPESIIQAVFDKTHSLKTLSYFSSSEERFGKELRKFSSSMVISRNPFRLYYRQKSPNDGLEILFREDRDKGNAWVNPNGFPYITLHLGINGTHLRKNRHHSIYEADFAFLADLLSHLFEKHRQKADQYFKLTGPRDFDGHACWIISIKNPEYKIISYKVSQKISPMLLSRKLHINLYKILELNPGLDYDKDLQPGECIKIPTDYGSEMELWIDKTRNVPLKLKVVDEKGLFEQYEFTQVVLDPVLSQDTWRPGNPAYRFR